MLTNPEGAALVIVLVGLFILQAVLVWYKDMTVELKLKAKLQSERKIHEDEVTMLRKENQQLKKQLMNKPGYR